MNACALRHARAAGTRRCRRRPAHHVSRRQHRQFWPPRRYWRHQTKSTPGKVTAYLGHATKILTRASSESAGARWIRCQRSAPGTAGPIRVGDSAIYPRLSSCVDSPHLHAQKGPDPSHQDIREESSNGGYFFVKTAHASARVIFGASGGSCA